MTLRLFCCLKLLIILALLELAFSNTISTNKIETIDNPLELEKTTDDTDTSSSRQHNETSLDDMIFKRRLFIKIESDNNKIKR